MEIFWKITGAVLLSLVLGMTGAAALLLLISVASSVMMVSV